MCLYQPSEGLVAFAGDEVAVTDLEAAAEFLVVPDRLVEFAHSVGDAGDQVRIRALLFDQILLERRPAVFRPVGRLQCLEGKSPAEGVVDQGQRSVGGVHHAEDVDVLRDVEPLVGIDQRDGVVLAALVGTRSA